MSRQLHILGMGWAILSVAASAAPPVVEVQVDTTATIARLDHFWNGTGLAHRLDRPDVRQNMQYLGTVPYGGCQYVRPHSLLKLIKVRDGSTEADRYDWTRLDAYLDVVVSSDNRLIFELMGDPTGACTDFAEPAQAGAWRHLVAALARHLEQRYSTAEVRRWYFESWNEPNINYARDWRSTAEFLAYYDACAAGLADADPALRFGGPGVTLYFSDRGMDFLRALLTHWTRGESCFGGPVRLDFVSFHIKAKLPELVDQTEATMAALVDEFGPAVAALPFLNSECDMKWGWNSHTPERQDAWYAAYIARQVVEHQVRLVQGHGWRIRISNDNAFLGDWDQRTQLTLFESDDGFTLIKKPAHNIFTLLSLLGDEVCGDQLDGPATGLTMLATRRGTGQVAVLLANYVADFNGGTAITVDLALDRLPMVPKRLAHYRIDQEHGNPYGHWAASNRQEGDIAWLRPHQELGLLGEPQDVDAERVALRIDLPPKAVSLVLVTIDAGGPPPAVTGLRARRYPTPEPGTEDIMLTWRCETRTVRTYEVLAADTADGPFERVNAAELICTGWIDRRPAGRDRYYRVRARDYWGRHGPLSETLAVAGDAAAP